MLDPPMQILSLLSYCKNRKALNSKTIKAYSIDLRQFCEYSNNSSSKESICSYLSFSHTSFKPKTVKRKIAALKAFTHYLMIEDIIDVNPFDKIDASFRKPIILPKGILINTIETILSSAYKSMSSTETEYSNKAAIRDIIVLELLFATEARMSEVCSLALSAFVF